MTFTPYPHQRSGSAAIEQFNGRALLADQQGLGKTSTVYLWARRNPDIRPIVVGCPAYLKYHWEKEALRHFNMTSEILEGETPYLNSGLTISPIYIINYDILQYWMDFLVSIKPKLVVWDEIHLLKTKGAIRTKAAKEITKGVPHVVGISGTPFVNRHYELYPILNMIRPDLFQSPILFAQEYCKVKVSFGRISYSGSKNHKILHTLLEKELMIRRLKRDVLKDLPEKQQIALPIPIARKAEYQKARDDFINWLRENKPGKAHKARTFRAKAIMRLGYLRRLVGELKLQYVMNWIDDFLENNDTKLVIFGIHHKVLQPLYQRYKHISVLVNGEIVGRARDQAKDQFNHDPDTRLFLGNIQAGGLGLSLKASTLAFIELPWSPGEVSQASDRIHGIGRGEKGIPPVIYFLIAQDTVEEKLAELIHEKQQTLAATLDGEDESAEYDIIEMLLKHLEKAA